MDFTSGKIVNCYNNNEILGAFSTGGIVGSGGGEYINCYNLGKISGGNIGGIAGQLSGVATNCLIILI